MSDTLTLDLPPARPLRVLGIGRDADWPASLQIYLTDTPTAGEMRELLDFIREWRASSDQIKQ